MPSAHARADGRRRRDSLLDAALECFSEYGILGTGIERIRRRAGASPSSVYHHFGGLDDLAASLLIRTFERLIGHLTEAVSHANGPEQAIRSLVRSYLEWVFDHPNEARFLYQAPTLELGGTHRDDVRLAKADLSAALFERLDRLTQGHAFPRWSWAQLNAVVLGPSQDACRHLLAGEDIDRAWALEELPDIAWASVRTASPAEAP